MTFSQIKNLEFVINGVTMFEYGLSLLVIFFVIFISSLFFFIYQLDLDRALTKIEQ